MDGRPRYSIVHVQMLPRHRYVCATAVLLYPATVNINHNSIMYRLQHGLQLIMRV